MHAPGAANACALARRWNPPVQLIENRTRPRGSRPPQLDIVGRRLFVGCGNPFNPSVITLDADLGTQIGLPIRIGRGVYSVKYDAARNHVYAASGVAGNIAIIQATPGIAFGVREAVFTKPGARTLAFDPASGAVFTAAPDGRFNPSTFVNEDLAGALHLVYHWPVHDALSGSSARFCHRPTDTALRTADRITNCPFSSSANGKGGVTFFPNDIYPNTVEVISYKA